MQVFMILTDATGKKKKIPNENKLCGTTRIRIQGEEQPRVLFKPPDLCALPREVRVGTEPQPRVPTPPRRTAEGVVEAAQQTCR